MAEERCRKVTLMAHRCDDVAAKVIDDLVKATDVREGDVDLVGVDNLLGDDLFSLI